MYFYLRFTFSYLIIIQNIFALLSPVYEEDARGLLRLVTLTSASLGLGLATLGLGVYCTLVAGARADQPRLLLPALLYTPVLVLKDAGVLVTLSAVLGYPHYDSFISLYYVALVMEMVLASTVFCVISAFRKYLLKEKSAQVQEIRNNR